MNVFITSSSRRTDEGQLGMFWTNSTRRAALLCVGLLSVACASSERDGEQAGGDTDAGGVEVGPDLRDAGGDDAESPDLSANPDGADDVAGDPTGDPRDADLTTSDASENDGALDTATDTVDRHDLSEDAAAEVGADTDAAPDVSAGDTSDDVGPSCLIDDLTFDWPMPGSDADDWVINNYVDLDTDDGQRRDYMGSTGSAARTYDNHRGVDVDVPNFRAMDADFPILAAAPGEVINLNDSRFDRNTSCSGQWNFVTLRHANGFTSVSGHLKQNSVVVDIGDMVEAGDTLAVVGSSGCSTAPHLHFEVHDCDGQVVDPFLEDMWTDPPIYLTEIGFMDIALTAGGIDSVNDIKDPPDNVTLIAPGQTLGIGMSMGGGGDGDAFSVRIERSDGSLFALLEREFTQYYRHSYWYWNRTIDDEPGEWTVEVRVNDALSATYHFDVSNLAESTSFQQTRHHIPAADYQAVFDDITAADYRPIWVDGYEVDGETYFNAIFDRSTVTAWSAYHGLNGGEYQTTFDDRVDAGYRLVHVDSYPVDGVLNYAAIFEKSPGTAWVTYHGVTEATHASNWTTYVDNQGYRPVVISPVEIGGTVYVTALYDKDDVGSFWAEYGLSSAEYQTRFTEQTASDGPNRRLAYLNAYNDDGGTPRFSAIWNDLTYGGWAARHDLTVSGFQDELDTWIADPYDFGTRIVTGYDNGSGSARFGGLWTAE